MANNRHFNFDISMTALVAFVTINIDPNTNTECPLMALS